MERSSKITLIVIIAVLILVGWYAYSVLQKNQEALSKNSAAAQSLATKEGQSAYTDIDGNPVALDDYLGKILVVNSWASWCPFCSTELVNLSRVGQEYADKNVQVLAINRAEPGTTAAAFLQSLSINDNVLLVLDADDRFYTSIEGFTMPETLFYDETGSVVFHKRGTMSYEELKAQIESMIVQEYSTENEF